MADALRKIGPEAAERVTLRPYLDRMDLAYAAADLVVARSGALTLAELAALGKPSVLIPLPTSAGDHQLENARRMEEAGAAVVVEQGKADAAKKIGTTLRRFAADCAILDAMARGALAQGKPDAAKQMADAIGLLGAGHS